MGSAYLFQEIFTMAGPLAEFCKVWTLTLARLWIFSILLLKNYGNFEVIPKRLSTLLPKMNVQPMQKKKVAMWGILCCCWLRNCQNKWTFFSSQHILKAFAIFSPNIFSTFSEAYPTTGHFEETVEIHSFATAFKLFNFDTVENKTDHADYGDVSDEFADSTENMDNEYGVDMQDKRQTFVNCLSVLPDLRYKLTCIQPSLEWILLHWWYQ